MPVVLLLALAACGGSEPSSTGQPSAGASGAAANNGGAGAAASDPVNAAGAAGSGGSAGTGNAQAGSDSAGSGASGSGGSSAGQGGATAGNEDAGSDPMGGTGGTGAGAGGAPPDMLPATGTFPAITDPWLPGPFDVTTKRGAGPAGNATVLYPSELGQDGLKHPIVVWDNGAGQTGLSIYGDLLNHLASHGFAVYAANSATDGGQELLDGLDWMIAQAADSSSDFYEKLDTSKTAAMGHSQGSIATFAIAGDPRLTTTIHLSGGTNPDIAEGHATLPNLHRPAAFMCGEPGGDGLFVGDTASEWCAYDFEHTDVPVFLVQIKGASHISAPGMTTGACAAWLRWQLMDDMTMRMQFAGDDCVLCSRANWMTMSKGL